MGRLCAAAWCSGSGSVPSEIAEPTCGAQSYGYVFIKALQSKDFLEILLICVNFNANSSRVFEKIKAKIPIILRT